MVVLPGTGSRSRWDLDRLDGRTDIPILLVAILGTLGDHDPHHCAEYVREGIDRFRTGKYGAHHATGFMAGTSRVAALPMLRKESIDTWRGIVSAPNSCRHSQTP